MAFRIPPPSRISLVTQTFDLLKESILQGRWSDSLPSETTLAEQMQISRSTLRRALERLQREKIIDAGRGRRARILTKKSPVRTSHAELSIALASSIPLHAMPASALSLIERVQHYLHKAGRQVEIHFGSPFSLRSSKEAFQEILRQREQVGCWLFFSPTRKIQDFLQRESIPAVIAGSSFDGISIPAIDESHSATVRHAIHLLRNQGHRRISLLISDQGMAGELAAEKTFKETIAPFRDGSMTVKFPPSREGMLMVLNRLLRLKQRPSALLIFQGQFAQAVTGHLLQMGLKIPKDISVIALNAEGYLDYSVPSITRYAVDPLLYARKLYRLALRISKGEHVPATQSYVWPRLIKGDSVGHSPET